MDARVAIIGAGPLGLELAVAFGRAGIDYVQFDARQIGQTIASFPPQTRFFSSNDRIAIAGVPLQTPDQSKATREVYLAYLRSVVQQFELEVHTYEPVMEIRREAGGFGLTTDRRGERRNWRVKAIVLATGGTAHPRRLGAPGEELPHVHCQWSDPHEYFGQRVVVIGGKNSAVETALRLHHAGARVMLCHRRPELPAKSIKYWLLPEINGLMASGQIQGYMNTRVVAITPTHVRIETVDDPHEMPPWEVEADFVIPQIGYEADMSLCRMAGVELGGDRQLPTFDPQTMQTNVPGVYLCGTVTGGTQDKYTIFIENGHIHVERIIAHLMGQAKPPEPAPIANPES